MLTIKWTDTDGIQHISEACDVQASMDGKWAKAVSWIDGWGHACTLDQETTIYVMNDGGSTVAKYVILGGLSSQCA
jgi:hypothetical protein